MIPKKLRLLLLLVTIFIFSQCTKTEDVIYDVYFWTNSLDPAARNSTLFINGNKEGILFNTSFEIDCYVVDSILNHLIHTQLSNGRHQFEVESSDGSTIAQGSLRIKSNGYSFRGGIGGISVRDGEECFAVSFSF